MAAYRDAASGSRERPLLCGREPASSRTADERGLRDLGEAKTASAFSASALFWGLPADASAKYPAWASAAALQPRLRGLCCWVAIPPTLRS